MSKRKIISMVLGIMIILSLGLTAGCTQQTPTTAANDTGSSQANDTAVSETTESVQADGTATSSTTDTGNAQVTGTDTDGDGIPDDIEKTYGTNPYTSDTDGDGQNDKEDQQPTTATDMISETSTTDLPVSVEDIRVEDNATDDHLEMTIKNTGSTVLENFDIFYTITDKLDNTTESYYFKLDGLSLAAGETKTIHFDNLIDQSGHYYGNPYGLYGTSANGLVFNIELHSMGYKVMTMTVEKDQGVEVPD